jgi:hypothetical protein
MEQTKASKSDLEELVNAVERNSDFQTRLDDRLKQKASKQDVEIIQQQVTFMQGTLAQELLNVKVNDSYILRIPVC